MTLEIPLFAVVWREEKLIVFLEKVTRGTTNMNTWTNLLPPLINSCCITGTERPKAAVKKKKKSIQVRVTIGIMSWHCNIWISVGYMILIKLYMKLYIPEPHNLRTLLHYAIKLWNLRKYQMVFTLQWGGSSYKFAIANIITNLIGNKLLSAAIICYGVIPNNVLCEFFTVVISRFWISLNIHLPSDMNLPLCDSFFFALPFFLLALLSVCHPLNK